MSFPERILLRAISPPVASKILLTSTVTKNIESMHAVIADTCALKLNSKAMFLSELLPPSKVEKITLVDKMWPRHGNETKKHHLNPDHLYHAEWPIRLARSAQDLKQGGDRYVCPAPYF